ncbi:PREDICTED: transcription factor IIIB 90 kDa subunit-like [Lupinus angustifolius]|uniref:transcription factor IIIB 90 kDa subunit-like n=1 Tax=Lupinus angustifolius TaxID=3871 RepID=UPI00092EA6EF|nr:PREDICTED: transcription factor IIIB 90 kDa subunit-like [Lupinus angustifolius]
MNYLSCNLGVEDYNMPRQALAFYRIALERKFTRGRKSEQVQAACLYIAFRANDKPYLLIDFSNWLRTNVYVLGAVFLQLCRVLSLSEHPIVQKSVDPSLFIYKYTNNLLKERNVRVSETALNIIASMKRDWMQTGRKPNGLCGAAIYIAALAHGFKFSKTDILRIVHVCESTLTKRLVEFENTDSAKLTIEELNEMAKEEEKNPIKIPDGQLNNGTSKDLLCEHKDSDVPYFALGLCETCYRDFDKLSGGLGGGLDPPAFQRAERERTEKSHSEESADKSDDLVKASNGADESRIENLHTSESESIGATVNVSTKYDQHDESHEDEDMNTNESETFSDIDDQEVDGYIADEEAKQQKKILWENEFSEYLKEQADRVAIGAKTRKRRPQEAKNSGPFQSAAEATRQMFEKKRISSKINYSNLDKLYELVILSFYSFCFLGACDNKKKVRFDLPSDDHDKIESKVEDNIKDDELGSMDEIEDDNVDGEYENSLYDENADQKYDYEYDDDYSNYDG